MKTFILWLKIDVNLSSGSGRAHEKLNFIYNQYVTPSSLFPMRSEPIALNILYDFHAFSLSSG